LCDRHGTLLIVDEVFCGFGRIGRMFGFDHEEVTSDIVAMSKRISGGYLPVAAVTGTSALRESFKHEPVTQGFRYGHTTGGHAVASAVANAVLDTIAEGHLVADAATQGVTMLAELGKLRSHPTVVDVRGLGMAMAIETDAQESAAAVLAAARRNGLLLKQQGNVILVVPPLTINGGETAEMVGKIDAAFSDVA
jgi:adenosylmethionine-8-amino-7-oxononanoate aminotransferase